MTHHPNRSRKPTATQVRKHYVDQGYDVRISMDGHVTFRLPETDGPWLEGRWVSEYRKTDDGHCVLV